MVGAEYDPPVAIRRPRMAPRPPRRGSSPIVAAALIASSIAIVTFAGSSARAAPTAVSAGSMATVTCDKAQIPTAKLNPRFQLVLGEVAMPTGSLGPSYEWGIARHQPWPFWIKVGVQIRAGSPAVVISVPKAWHGRVAIGWGNSRLVTTARFATCPTQPGSWGSGYPGGIHFRSALSACVPLVVRVGQQRAIVQFGIGRATPEQQVCGTQPIGPTGATGTTVLAPAA